MWGISGVGERKWVKRNGSNRPSVPWVESLPFRNWVEWTWVDLEKCQGQGRQHIDFDPSPFNPVRPQSIRPKLFDQKGRPNFFDLFHSTHFMQSIRCMHARPHRVKNQLSLRSLRDLRFC